MRVHTTTRFTINGIEMDNDADCRFFFWLEKRNGRWGIVYYTLLYDKVPASEAAGQAMNETLSCSPG